MQARMFFVAQARLPLFAGATMVFFRSFGLVLLGGLLPGLPVLAADPPAPESIATFQERAAKFNDLLTIPTFERTPAEIEKSVADTLAAADAGLNKIGSKNSTTWPLPRRSAHSMM